MRIILQHVAILLLALVLPLVGCSDDDPFGLGPVDAGDGSTGGGGAVVGILLTLCVVSLGVGYAVGKNSKLAGLAGAIGGIVSFLAAIVTLVLC